MTPFENVIHELGSIMNITLTPDAHQSCLITFPQDDVSIQIDLDTHADRIVVGTELGRITIGPYREKIFFQAMKVNGSSIIPRGILAFSEKNDSLILYQYLLLAPLTGEKLNNFLELFLEHTIIWKQALAKGEIPPIEEDVQSSGNRMFGLNP